MSQITEPSRRPASRLLALLMGIALALSACSNTELQSPSEAIDDQTSVLGSAQGNTYYVSVSGSNANNGLSTGAPWRNLTFAIGQAQPGDTVLVMNGTYTGNMNSGQAHFVINKNGTANNWIRFKALAGHNPKLLATNTSAVELYQSSYIEVSGFEIVGQGFNAGHSYGYGIVANTGHHLLVANNEIYGFPVGGVGSQAISHFVIKNNVIHENSYWNDNQGSGISMWRPANNGFGNDSNGYSDYIVGNTIYANQNKVYGSGIGFPNNMTDGNGIILDQNNLTGYTGRTLVANNVVFNNGGKAIHVFMSSHADVYNNTTYHNSWTPELTGHRAEIDTYDATDVRIANNIAWPNSGTDGVALTSSSNVSSYNNIVVGSNNVGSSDIAVAGNPGLVNPTTNPGSANFALTASSSAIDAGLSLVNDGFGGTSRPSGPASDIGAFEYSSGAQSPAAPSATTTTTTAVAPSGEQSSTTTTTTTTSAPKKKKKNKKKTATTTTTTTTTTTKKPAKAPKAKATTTTVKAKPKATTTTVKAKAKPASTTTTSTTTTTTTTTTTSTTVAPPVTLPDGWSPFATTTTTTTTTVPSSGGFSLEGLFDKLGESSDADGENSPVRDTNGETTTTPSTPSNPSGQVGSSDDQPNDQQATPSNGAIGEQPEELAFADEAPRSDTEADPVGDDSESELTVNRFEEPPRTGPSPLIPILVGVTFMAVIGAAFATSRRRPLKPRR